MLRALTDVLVAGLKRLDMVAPGPEGRRQYESLGLFSPDGEHLPFNAPVVTEGRPEEWLNRVEEAMFATTKKHVFKVLEESKSELPSLPKYGLP
jgi:dynein heavy chain, axonemal